MARLTSQEIRWIAIGKTRDKALQRYAARRKAGRTSKAHVAAMGHMVREKLHPKRTAKASAPRKARSKRLAGAAPAAAVTLG